MKGSGDLEADDFNPWKVSESEWCFFKSTGKVNPFGGPSSSAATSISYDRSRSLFSLLAKTWDCVERLKHTGSGSKKKATTVLSNYFRILLVHCPGDLIYALYLCLHKVAPDYFGVEIGVGEAALIRTISETYGRSEQQVKHDLQNTGDLGTIAQESKVSMTTLVAPSRLSLAAVFDQLLNISKVKGLNTVARRRDMMKKLLVSAIDFEPRYIVRFLEKQLRIGVKSATVLAALAWAITLTPMQKIESGGDGQSAIPSILHKLLRVGVNESLTAEIRSLVKLSSEPVPKSPETLAAKTLELEQAIRQAYSCVPNLGVVAFHLLTGCCAEELIERCQVTPGVPVAPMLAKPTKGLGDVLEAMSGVAFKAEYKYDGERIQIHKVRSEEGDGVVHLYSRNMETLDEKYPDVKEVAVEAVNESTLDFILDAEVVAYKTDTQEILPFQILAGRKRKDVDVKSLEVQVKLYVFDCLYFNGESLVRQALQLRQEKLRAAVHELPGKLEFAKGAVVSDTTELEQLLLEAIDNKTEGLMVKNLETSYEPSKRSVNWLKLKKDYLDDLGDSVDLIPIGAFYGRGKRSGCYGAYLLAVHDGEDEETFKTVCKVATGFTEQDLATHYEYFKDKVLTAKPFSYLVNDRMTPDVWLPAEQVWECRAADLSISPVHTAGMGRRAEGRGIGLRFPRYLKIRQDKNTEQATDSQVILGMYDQQFKERKDKKKTADDDEDDFMF